MFMNEKELRELDAWVGTTLFGYVRIKKVPDPTDNRQISGSLYSPQGITHDCNQESYIPSYSNNPSDAMDVLEVCAKKRTESWSEYRPDATLIIHAPREEWENQWIVASDAECSIEAKGDTLPLAICLFAKKLFTDKASSHSESPAKGKQPRPSQ